MLIPKIIAVIFAVLIYRVVWDILKLVFKEASDD